jgi:DNA polymerase-1
VQGSAADLIKLAMINIQKEIKARKLKVKMISTVHDELVFEAPPNEEKEIINLVRDKMANAVKLSVPIEVSVKVGKNWLEMEEV